MLFTLLFWFSWYLIFCLQFSVMSKNGLIIKVNFKIYDATTWLTNNYNTYWRISQEGKAIRQWYLIRNIFFWKNHTQNAMELVIPDQTKLFFNKAACLRPEACNFIKKETPVFSCEFCKIFQNNVFTEQQWAAAFGLVMPCLNSDLYLISKISGTALLETIVYYSPLHSLSQENRKTLLPTFLDTSTT